MKINAVVGVLLIVFGVFVLAYGGFSYTKKEKVIDLGPIQATTEEHKTVPLPPILGGAAVIAGLAVLVLGTKKKT